MGGIKEKVLAAHRAGISRVILPRRNEKDVHEVPADVQVRVVIITRTRADARTVCFIICVMFYSSYCNSYRWL